MTNSFFQIYRRNGSRLRPPQPAVTSPARPARAAPLPRMADRYRCGERARQRPAGLHRYLVRPLFIPSFFMNVLTAVDRVGRRAPPPATREPKDDAGCAALHLSSHHQHRCGARRISEARQLAARGFVCHHNVCPVFPVPYCLLTHLIAEGHRWCVASAAIARRSRNSARRPARATHIHRQLRKFRLTGGARKRSQHKRH